MAGEVFARENIYATVLEPGSIPDAFIAAIRSTSGTGGSNLGTGGDDNGSDTNDTTNVTRPDARGTGSDTANAANGGGGSCCGGTITSQLHQNLEQSADAGDVELVLMAVHHPATKPARYTVVYPDAYIGMDRDAIQTP
eukprot:104066_1